MSKMPLNLILTAGPFSFPIMDIRMPQLVGDSTLFPNKNVRQGMDFVYE